MSFEDLRDKIKNGELEFMALKTLLSIYDSNHHNWVDSKTYLSWIRCLVVETLDEISRKNHNDNV